MGSKNDCFLKESDGLESNIDGFLKEFDGWEMQIDEFLEEFDGLELKIDEFLKEFDGSGLNIDDFLKEYDDFLEHWIVPSRLQGAFASSTPLGSESAGGGRRQLCLGIALPIFGSFFWLPP